MGIFHNHFPAGLILFAILVPGIAEADDLDVLNFYVTGGYSHDDNLFRLPDGVIPSVVGTSRSDSIAYGTVGVKINKPYRQQTFKLDTSLSHTRFTTYKFLDFSARNYLAAWNWHATPYLSGTLSAQEQQSFNGFTNFRNYNQKSVSTVKNRHFDIDSWVASNWHLLGGLEEVKSINDLGSNQFDNTDVKTADVGFAYYRTSARSITMRVRQSTGSYPDRVVNLSTYTPNKFRQRDYELQLQYALDDKLNLTAKADYQHRKHELVPERDFQGWTGNMALIWAQTGKLNWNLEATRYIGADLTALSNYATTNKVSFGPSWTPTGKQQIDLRAYKTHYYTGGTVPGSLGIQENDQIKGLTVSWGWQATRNLNVNASVAKENRNSNLGYNYKDLTASVGLNWSFL